MNQQVKRYNAVFISLTVMLAVCYAAIKLNLQLNYFHLQPGFVTTKAFFIEYLKYPGGVAEYLGTLVAALLKFKWVGALVMVGLTTTGAWAVYKLHQHWFKHHISALFYFIVPLTLGLLLWQQVNFPVTMVVNWTLFALLVWGLVKVNKPLIFWIALPVVYFVLGAPFLYVSVLLGALNGLIKRHSWWHLVVMLALAVLIPFLAYKALFSVSLRQAWWSFLQPVPVFWHYTYTTITWLWLGWSLIVTSVAIIVSQFKPLVFKHPLVIAICLSIALSLSSSVVLKTLYPVNDRTEARIAYTAWQQDWPKVLNLSKKGAEYNRMVNFYTNQALFFNGNLATQMFNYEQLLGVEALFIDQPFTAQVCMPSAYLYHHLGLIGNSLRFAYEGQTLKPNSPFVLMLIIDNLIIMGDTTNAKRFITSLQHNLFYQRWALDRLAYIQGQASQLSARQVSLKQELLPQTDFFVASPAYNLQQLVAANPDNLMAQQYWLSWYLLKNEVGNFVNRLIKSGQYSGKPLPKTYQEALLLYLVLSKNPLPEARQWSIDESIKTRFKYFNQTMGTNPKTAYAPLKKGFADTYWFYFMCDSPVITKAAVKTRNKNIEH